MEKKNNKMKPNREVLIKCPNCNCSYLPAEVYYPKSFLGAPEEVERLENGDIETYFGKSMDLVEHFECEMCGAHFKAIASVRFNTFLEEELDFNEEHATSLVKNKIYFDEG